MTRIVTLLRLGAFTALFLLTCLFAGTEAQAAAPEALVSQVAAPPHLMQGESFSLEITVEATVGELASRESFNVVVFPAGPLFQASGAATKMAIIVAIATVASLTATRRSWKPF